MLLLVCHTIYFMQLFENGNLELYIGGSAVLLFSFSFSLPANATHYCIIHPITLPSKQLQILVYDYMSFDLIHAFQSECTCCNTITMIFLVIFSRFGGKQITRSCAVRFARLCHTHTISTGEIQGLFLRMRARIKDFITATQKVKTRNINGFFIQCSS